MDLLSAPGFLDVQDLLRVLYSDPAGTFNFPLKNEELKHALAGSKQTFECVPSHALRE